MTSHWAESYLGQDYDAANDCWAFFRQVQREQFGVHVPVVDVDATDRAAVARAFRDHGERDLWQAVTLPDEGDAVLMAHHRYPSHVGVWIDVDGGGVLHCAPGAGVIFSRRSALVAAGWQHLEYYRRAV